MIKIKGNKVLSGEVQVNGSKNAALGLIIASLLTKGNVCLENIPNIDDVKILLNILKYLNVNVIFKENTLNIDASKIEYKSLLIDEVKKIRASSYFMGAFLSLFNKVEIYNPGGCSFAYRPIDYHLKGFNTFGVIVNENIDTLNLEINELKSGYFFIDNISVGTTIDLLLFFALKENTFILDNIALEPEVLEVVNFLKLLGVEIKRIKEKTLFIKGKKDLKKDIKYRVMNDRIEAGTFALIGATLGDNLRIKGFNIFDNLYLLNIFIKLNVPFKMEKDALIISRHHNFNGLHIKTNPFPFFATDLQPLLCVFLSLAKEESSIIENIYPSRLSHIEELNKIGFNLESNNNKIIIKPLKKFKSNDIKGKDLRGGSALIMASLLVDDVVYFEGIEYVNRGYENFIERLKSLGAEIYEEEN